MSLPDMKSGTASREFLRVAGGYGAEAVGTSPAGGLDVDDAGNLATDGDVTVKGAIAAGNPPQALTNASGAVDGARIQASTVGSGQLADAAVGPTKLDHGATYRVGRLGVGVAPIRPLHIESNATDGTRVIIDNTATGGNRWDVIANATGQGDLRFWNVDTNKNGLSLASNGDVKVDVGNLGVGVDPVSRLDVNGDGKIRGGHLETGESGIARGMVSAHQGGGGAAPGCIRLSSPNGTAWYLFVEDDGTLKVHASLPTQNSDGAVVGSQT